VSIPYVVDGETEIDSALFNPWIDLINESIAAYDLPETVDNALAGVFNILDYGADPTGVTNSTTAIQAAATAARASTLPHSSTNGRVYAPQGTYLYSDEIDMRDVPFTGQGWGTTFKATHADAVFLLGSSYETTGHFRIDGNDLAEYGAHFYPMAGGYYPHIYVQDCTIYGVTFNGTQNSIIDLMSVSNCGRANLVLRNGCGSLIFNHFESTYADRGYYLWITEDGTDLGGASAYSESSSIYFVQGICEYGDGVEAGTATGGSGTTLVDSTATWTVNEWADAWVTMDPGGGDEQGRRIVSNTATTLTVESAWDVTPTTEDYTISFASIRVDAGSDIVFNKFAILPHEGSDTVPNLEIDREVANGSQKSEVRLIDCAVNGSASAIGVSVRGSNAVLQCDVATQFVGFATGILVGTNGAVRGTPNLSQVSSAWVDTEDSGTLNNVSSLIYADTEAYQAPGTYATRNLVTSTNNDGATGYWFTQTYDGTLSWYDGTGYSLDTNLYRSAANLLKTDDSFELPGTYLLPLKLGTYRLWVNPGDGKLYINSSAPANATDGTIVGSQ
jgi:hypothetical protein